MSDVLRLPLPALVSECDLPEPGLINIVSLAKELQGATHLSTSRC